jgi:flagellar motor protein MotB
MKTFISFGLPAILAISLVLLLNPMASSQTSYGQVIGEANQTSPTNQTSGQNTTQQAQQQLEEANQQIQQAQQQKQQAEQQLKQANQTQQQSNQSKQQDPEMNEKLLNYTNAAILALNEDNTSAAQDSLVQIQNALINASGKQVVVIPAPAVSSPADNDDDEGDSE